MNDKPKREKSIFFSFGFVFISLYLIRVLAILNEKNIFDINLNITEFNSLFFLVRSKRSNFDHFFLILYNNYMKLVRMRERKLKKKHKPKRTILFLYFVSFLWIKKKKNYIFCLHSKIPVQIHISNQRPKYQRWSLLLLLFFVVVLYSI